ncbi:MAG: O-antigen ligase family protein [Oscillospiraceae bacterium]|nr:O-antigen ligase family protein [Oscillospiraceae bacterium]
MPSKKKLEAERLRKEAESLKYIEIGKSWIAEILFILMMCVQPMYFNHARYYYLTGHKYWFFLICVSSILCMVMGVYMIKLILGHRFLPKKLPTVAEWAALGYALITFISALASPFAGEADADVWGGFYERHDGALTQFLYVAIFLIIANWYKPRMRDFGIFSIAASAISIMGLLQFYGVNVFNMYFGELEEIFRHGHYVLQFRSTLGNIMALSTFVCITVLLCGFLFVRSKSKWSPVLIAGSALSFWMLISAGAESGMVGALGAVVLAIPFIVESREYIGRFLILVSSWAAAFTLQRLFYNCIILKADSAGRIVFYAVVTITLLAVGLLLTVFWKKKAASKEQDSDVSVKTPIKWKHGAILLASVIILGIASVEVIGRQADENSTGFGELFYQAREILHGNLEDEFGTMRVYIWRHALSVVPDYLLIGSGPDTFYFAFPEEAQRFYGETYDKAHNEYLQILICQGIFGLLFYLTFLGTLFIKSIKKSFTNPILMASLAAFTGYGIQALFNISTPIASQMMWVISGVMAISLKQDQS